MSVSEAVPGVFVHERGLCESRSVGAGTRIWAFAHVLPGARIGRDCNICDHVFIENDVIVGDAVTVKCGVQLWDGVRLGNRVFVGPNATFTNDLFPRSKRRPERFAETVIEDDASIGANATILPGLRIGRGAMIGAGAVVTRNVPAHAIVVGNPAVIRGYDVGGRDKGLRAAGSDGRARAKAGTRVAVGVGGCSLWRLPHFADMRGELAPLEFGADLPFRPQRSFLVYGVPSEDVRGEHAHRRCEQLLVAAHGRLSVLLDDGRSRTVVVLDEPTLGLYVPPMMWAIQHNFGADAVLLVFASEPYDADDYIRDYETFLAAVTSKRS